MIAKSNFINYDNKISMYLGFDIFTNKQYIQITYLKHGKITIYKYRNLAKANRKYKKLEKQLQSTW